MTDITEAEIEDALIAGLEEARKYFPEAARWPDDYDSSEKAHVRKIFRAALTAAAKVPTQGWLPIESAPKDRRCLVWTGDSMKVAARCENFITGDVAWKVENVEHDGEILNVICRPTLWQELPASPSAGGNQ